MQRRTLLLGSVGLLAEPLAAGAQPAGKVYRIGMLERTSPETNAANLEGFRQGLRALGYVEGKQFVIEYRSAEGRDERFPSLAADLVRLKVDMILARGTPAVLAAKNASGRFPWSSRGWAIPSRRASSRASHVPAANVTGLSPVVTETYPKRVELLKELVPKATRIAALFNMANPAIPPQWKEVETAVRSLGLQPQLLDEREARGSRAGVRCRDSAAC